MSDDLIDLIKKAHSGVDFGVVNVTIKKYNGKISTIDSDKNITYRTERGNVEGLAIIGTIIKKTTEALKLRPVENPPTLTFTVFFDRKGEIRQLNVNDFNRVNLPKS